MPLFGRRREAEAAGFTVGVDGHRVVLGSRQGCEMLADLEDYVGPVLRRSTPKPDGRDSVAVQNAKMDYVEMAEAAVLVVTLAVEELVEQGVLREDDVPPRPKLPPLDPDLPTYDYIQSTYARAEQRVAWVRDVDALFRARDIAILRPLPPEE
ncbi:MAG: hypothetical protein JOZ46_00385 [Candidatus Dormibacteraeota bacterium]|nr:hypothetical protein [Candidatus Dormibacteraeota bacterium]MBV9524249.1 hypothetical protein [Candidatus Dormibacteraeota bacterium]